MTVAESAMKIFARIAVALGLGVILAAQAADTAPDLDTIAQRAQACTPCHGKEGRVGPDGYYPRIAGKPAGYLFNQLVNFRDGRRYFPMMNYLTGRQRDDYLKELAEYFARTHKIDIDAQGPKRIALLIQRS